MNLRWLVVIGVVQVCGGAAYGQQVFTNGIDVNGNYVLSNGLVPLDAGQTNAVVRDIPPTVGQMAGVDPSTGAVLDADELLTLQPRKLDLSNAANRPFVIAADQITGDGSIEISYSGSNVVVGLANTTVQISGDADISGDTAVGGDLQITSAIAIGPGSTATANGASAQGQNCSASVVNAHAEGLNATASGALGSHAEGAWTTASGSFGSHSEGLHSVASGLSSHAEGAYTTASGARSHAEGGYSDALGSYSHAQGYYSVAGGETSFAAGHYAEAMGNRATALGNGATATHDDTFVWATSGGTTEQRSSTTSAEFTVYAANGIRLLGGTTKVDKLEVTYLAPQGGLSMGSYTNQP